MPAAPNSLQAEDVLVVVTVARRVVHAVAKLQDVQHGVGVNGVNRVPMLLLLVSVPDGHSLLCRRRCIARRWEQQVPLELQALVGGECVALRIKCSDLWERARR